MTQGFYEAGGGSGEAPYLTPKGLKAYVTADWGIFKTFAWFMTGGLLEYSKGNPPCQGLNDCATLNDHHEAIWPSNWGHVFPFSYNTVFVLCTLPFSLVLWVPVLIVIVTPTKLL